MQEVSELNFRLNLLLAMMSFSEAELARKDEVIARQDTKISNQANEIVSKEARIAELDAICAERNNQIKAMACNVAYLKARQEAILSSTSWRLTAILRGLRRFWR